MAGKRVQVQKIQPAPSSKKLNKLQTYAQVCYFYPQYTLKSASKLPVVHIRALLNEAKRQQALYYSNMTQIVAAPHSQDGKNVGVLLDQFNENLKD